MWAEYMADLNLKHIGKLSTCPGASRTIPDFAGAARAERMIVLIDSNWSLR